MQNRSDHICQVNGDCQRYVEFWNLVFIQYNRHADGSLTPLPAKHVDTGLGFARLVTLLQGVDSNYDNDLFTGIIARTQALLGHSDEERAANEVGYRVIADHARAASFLIADGALPGNLGRNYVLRMIIRRAARFGKGLGFVGPFLAQVAEVVINEMGHFFTELVEMREHVLRTVTTEEERFQHTLDAALTQLESVLADLEDKRIIAGSTVFDLYATYGLPLEITRDVVGDRGYAVDEEGFKTASEAHRLASGAGAIGVIDADQLGQYVDLMGDLAKEGRLLGGVDHSPYGELALETQVLAILQNGERVESAESGREVEVVLAATPFYVEAGGQVSDTGTIHSPSGWQIRVTAARTPIAGLVVHEGEVIGGELRGGDPATVAVDADHRWDIMRNHTATHLLHQELRDVLGDHVLQQGSLVAPDRLRFDFSHPAMLTPGELAAVEHRVNKAILDNHPVRPGHASLKDAKERGAMALFGEKYGDVVRTIQVGDPAEPYSLELCGGTHVNSTAEIGLFHLVSEGSVGANLRRVEAVTGRRAQALAQERLQTLDRTAAQLNTMPDEVDNRVITLLEELQAAQKEVTRLQRELARGRFERLMETKVRQAAGTPVLAAAVDGATNESLREMTDWFRDKVGSGVAALGTVSNDRPLLIVAVTPDLVKRGLKAGDLIRPAAKLIGGGSGGRPTLAQAGGRDVTRLHEALALIPGLVTGLLGGDE